MNTILSKKQNTALRKDLRESIAAHNNKKDICANDAYNRTYKLGSIIGRNICRRAANAKSGNSYAKIAWLDLTHWAKSMLPEGKGYVSQDITEDLAPYVFMLTN